MNNVLSGIIINFWLVVILQNILDIYINFSFYINIDLQLKKKPQKLTTHEKKENEEMLPNFTRVKES